MIKHLIFIPLSLLFVASLEAQVKYSNEFLALGVGARAHGQGNAVVARIDDANASYWNPAGLAFIENQLQFSAMHAEWFAGIAKFDYIGIAKPLNSRSPSTIAFSVIRLGIDQIPNTLNLVEPDGTINFDNLSEFSAADYAFFISYAQQFRQKKPNRKLAIGGNVKIIRRIIGSFGNAWGFGLDGGLLFKRRNWQWGITARDITFTFNAWNFTLTEDEKTTFQRTGNVIPSSSIEITNPRILLGGAWIKKVSQKITFSTELDLHFTTDGQRNVLINSSSINIDPHIGLEVNYNSAVFLRAGARNWQNIQDDLDPEKETLVFQPTLGIGLQLGSFNLDYGFTDLGDNSPVLYSHVFSLILSFK